jgi:hypothetical protein
MFDLTNFGEPKVRLCIFKGVPSGLTIANAINGLRYEIAEEEANFSVIYQNRQVAQLTSVFRCPTITDNEYR